MKELTEYNFIPDANGNPLWVLVPYQDYLKSGVAELADDDAQLPHEVVALMVEHDCNLLSAWRRFKGLSQKDLSELTGFAQPAISRMKKNTFRYQKDTLLKLSTALQLEPSQLIDYDE